MATRKPLPLLGPRLAVAELATALPEAKRAAPFYLSAEWRSLMARLIAVRGRRCQRCGRTGCRIYGDHIIELTDGGAPLDESNIALLCGSCHTTKTVRARTERTAAHHRRGIDRG